MRRNAVLRNHVIVHRSVVIGQPDFVSIRALPPKYNSPLIVDSYAVASLEVSFQRFESISRAYLHVRRLWCAVQ